MKLFRSRGNPPKQADETPAPAAPAAISLSTEQKSLLETPIDPKAHRIILRRIYANKAERALNARRISDLPPGDSDERHVIRDEHGFGASFPAPRQRGARNSSIASNPQIRTTPHPSAGQLVVALVLSPVRSTSR